MSLGGAARNAAKHKVRQPLAELRFGTSADHERRAVERFGDQLREELNVKAVSLRPLNASPLLKAVVKLYKRSAAAKLGSRLKEAEEYLAKLNGDAVVKQPRNGTVEIVGVSLGSTDFTIEHQAEDGWAGVSDKGTEAVVEARLTPELKAEGLARDVIRFVQDNRKDAGLDVADKIALLLGTRADTLSQAIATHKATIASETQASNGPTPPSPADAHTAVVKVDGHDLTIGLRKV